MSEHQIRLRLTLITGQDEVGVRQVTLKPGDSIQLGRASSDSTKGMIATEDTLWLTSPVISRRHAVFDCSLNSVGGVRIGLKDAASSHGTYLLRGPCSTRIRHERIDIKDGDKIKFGEEVSRHDDTFQAPTFQISVQQIESPDSFKYDPEGDSQPIQATSSPRSGSYEVPIDDDAVSDTSSNSVEACHSDTAGKTVFTITHHQTEECEQNDALPRRIHGMSVEELLITEDKAHEARGQKRNFSEINDRENEDGKEPEEDYGYNDPDYEDFALRFSEDFKELLPNDVTSSINVDLPVDVSVEETKSPNHNLTTKCHIIRNEFVDLTSSEATDSQDSIDSSIPSSSQSPSTSTTNFNVHSSPDLSSPGAVTIRKIILKPTQQQLVEAIAPRYSETQQERPRKRLRTIAGAIGLASAGFISGAIATVTLLANLPENSFA